MKKYFVVIALIVAFFSFAAFERRSKAFLRVLEIKEPDIIGVDINKNGSIDYNEYICLINVDTYRYSEIKSTEDMKLWYLANSFAEKTLFDKNVKITLLEEKNSTCRFGEIFVDNQKFSQLLTDAQFNLLKQNKNAKKILLMQAEKINPVILNHKSNIYHKLDCKYGNIALDTKILPKSQLENNAKPCKFCHIKNEKKHISTTATFPLSITDKNLKLILSDFTLKLKPDNSCNSLMCKTILEEINKAKSTIDIAAYNFYPQKQIITALSAAKERGVKIRLVYDVTSKGLTKESVATQEIINLVGNENTNSDFDENTSFSNQLMHNKFIIFDNKKVFTGSMNFSKTGLSGFNNNSSILITSEFIAQRYTDEFEQMFSGKFHQNKSVSNNTQDIHIKTYFSPQNKTLSTHIIQLINATKTYIYIPAFVLTHDEFSDALIEAHKRGVEIKIIADATNISAKRSKISTLRNNGIKIKTENFAGKMHSKNILIDNKYLIIGSMNFSNSGENKNDENCLIIENERLTKFYKEYFEYLWNKIPEKYLTTNPPAESNASLGSCSDGIDNDYDGKFDTYDDGCKTIAAE